MVPFKFQAPVVLAVCVSYTVPSLFPTPAILVSPGWEVMELIRPMRGNPSPKSYVLSWASRSPESVPHNGLGRLFVAWRAAGLLSSLSTTCSWRPGSTNSAAQTRRPTQRTSSFGRLSATWLGGWMRCGSSCR